MQKEISKGKIIGKGITSGKIKIINNSSDASSVTEEHIILSNNLSPPLASLARRAAGFVLTGNEANHTIVYLKEILKPGLLLTDLPQIQEGDEVTVDGNQGLLFSGNTPNQETTIKRKEHKLNTKIYLQLGIPRVAETAAKLNTDGVTLFRSNLIIQEAGKHPEHYFRQGKEKELQNLLSEGIKQICKAFYPKPVWMRTMDFDSSELALYEGGEIETKENNPYLGLRGLAREIRDEHILKLEFNAIKEAKAAGFDNIGIIFPLVRDIKEYSQAKKVLNSVGLIPHKDIKVGVVFETPSACLQVNEFIEEGIDLAFVGINDITQYTLATDRTNNEMCHLYDPLHPSVRYLIRYVLSACKEKGIETTMNFLPPLKNIFQELIENGLDSITLQAQQVNEVSEILNEVESKMSLNK